MAADPRHNFRGKNIKLHAKEKQCPNTLIMKLNIRQNFAAILSTFALFPTDKLEKKRN